MLEIEAIGEVRGLKLRGGGGGFKDGHKTHYPSRRTIFRSASLRRITKDSSCRRIMRLVPVFILQTHNQTNYK